MIAPGQYKLLCSQSSIKDIKALPRLEVATVLEIMRSLMKAPITHNSRQLIPSGLYRVRAHNSRILYTIHEDIITVLSVKSFNGTGQYGR